MSLGEDVLETAMYESLAVPVHDGDADERSHASDDVNEWNRHDELRVEVSAGAHFGDDLLLVVPGGEEIVVRWVLRPILLGDHRDAGLRQKFALLEERAVHASSYGIPSESHEIQQRVALCRRTVAVDALAIAMEIRNERFEVLADEPRVGCEALERRAGHEMGLARQVLFGGLGRVPVVADPGDEDHRPAVHQ